MSTATSILSWCRPPVRPRLGPGEVQLWRVNLRLDPGRDAAIEAQVLSADERARAARYRFAAGRRRFELGRSALRCILAGYLDMAPADLRFAANAYGRPCLAIEAAPQRLSFNVSHAAELMLVAVGSCPEIGVDVERPRPDVAFLDIAERSFASEEFAALAALPAARQPAAFYACWTRKEAFVKACGEGLARPLSSFVVSLGEPASLLSVQGDAASAAPWTLMGFTPAPGYLGALALRAPPPRLRCWQYPEAP